MEIKPEFDPSIYSLENLTSADFETGEDYAGPTTFVYVCADYIASAIAMLCSCLHQCVVWALFWLLTLYIFVIWLPLDILFQDMNKFDDRRLL